MTVRATLCDPVLLRIGAPHGFGMRDGSPPAGWAGPRQVHGVAVAECTAGGAVLPEEADAILCRLANRPIAVVTADCVPILVASESSAVVAAIHAGWRGLAAGVVGEALAAIAALTDEPLHAAIGPHARACCYEVDSPVTEPLAQRFGEALGGAVRPARPGHHWLDLERLVVDDLMRCGVAQERIGRRAAQCTVCNPDRFESYRRDGAAAGRLVHWVAAAGPA